LKEGLGFFAWILRATGNLRLAGGFIMAWRKLVKGRIEPEESPTR
jgi:hypothetical protein